jgi:hypothetical protein
MQPLTQPNVRPGPGRLLRDYQLSDTAGQQMVLSDYRGKSNLVLITSGADDVAGLAGLLRELDSQSARLREYEAQVIVISSRAERFDLPAVRVLLDDRGNALRELGAPAVYITDKFREVVHRFDSLVSASDILGWVEFTAMQCPECHPPEWPPVE